MVFGGIGLNKQNLHTHTNYTDGKDTPEEVVLAAIEKGFDSIGFSEHTYLQYSSFPRQLTAERAVLYKNEIQALKQKYAGVIDIFCGLEYDFYSDVDTEGYDYLIGSVHYLDCKTEIASFDYGLERTIDYIKKYFDGDGLAFAKKYYETVAQLPKKKDFDIIGHFDLVTKNNEQGRFIDLSSKKYLDFGFEAIHALKGRIPFFEVNTGAISRGYRTEPYPQIEFLREFKSCGFGAVITSDCHNKDHLDCNFKQARELLISAGFDSRWILTAEGFKEIDI